jgi:hypothetical protein
MSFASHTLYHQLPQTNPDRSSWEQLTASTPHQKSYDCKVPPIHEKGERQKSGGEDDSKSSWDVWLLSELMIFILVGGIGLAYAHHCYYDSLHGTEVGSVESQHWVLRYVIQLPRKRTSELTNIRSSVSTALAISTTLCLTVTISIACSKLRWEKPKSDYISLKAFEGSLDIPSNTLVKFDHEGLRKSCVVLLLITILWCVYTERDDIKILTIARQECYSMRIDPPYHPFRQPPYHTVNKPTQHVKFGYHQREQRRAICL